jgi:hypothetical protein
MNYNWTIRPLSAPSVTRSCSHCGCVRAFVCSGNFRVNAQKKKLDVWLIYRCEKCGCTWNMSILSRVPHEDVDRGLYGAFLGNSAELALRYAFDASALARNNASVCYDSVRCQVSGDMIAADEQGGAYVTLNIENPYGIEIRLDKLLSETLGVSRSKVKRCIDSGDISLCGAQGGASKLKLHGSVSLKISPSAASMLSGTLRE